MTNFAAYSVIIFFVIIIVFGNCSTKQILLFFGFLDMILIVIAQYTGFVEVIWELLYTATLAIVFILGSYLDKTRKRVFNFNDPIVKRGEFKDAFFPKKGNDDDKAA